MDARPLRLALVVLSLCSLGATHRTRNFVVSTTSPQLAQQVAQAAEGYRSQLAKEWLGQELPDWAEPCPIIVHVGPHLGAGGETSFAFDRGRPFGWQMTIQGSHERLLDSVLPHEITHTIFATYFGRPLPRWADEGAATSIEHVSERQKHRQILLEVLTTNRGIPFNQMVAIRDYPSDILPLYAQGFSVAEYLIAICGRQRFIQFVGESMETGDWSAAVGHFYPFENLSQLQVSWLDWVRRGWPPIRAAEPSPERSPIQLVSAEQPAPIAPPSPFPAADERAVHPSPADTGMVPIRPAPIRYPSGEKPAPLPGVESRPSVATTEMVRDEETETVRDEEGLNWYARQRDRARVSRPPAESSSAPTARTTAHPSPLQTPGQVILQWGRPGTGQAGYGAGETILR